jgi:hypothetical protein
VSDFIIFTFHISLISHLISSLNLSPKPPHPSTGFLLPHTSPTAHPPPQNNPCDPTHRPLARVTLSYLLSPLTNHKLQTIRWQRLPHYPNTSIKSFPLARPHRSPPSRAPALSTRRPRRVYSLLYLGANPRYTK